MAAFSLVALAGFALSLLAQSPAAPAPAPPKVTARDIKKHLGRDVTACGLVVMYDCQSSTGALALDLDTPSPRNGISVEIPRQHWPVSLGNGITNRYVFAQVCARGKATKVRSRYHVVVAEADGIDITSPPPPAATLLDPTAVQSCAEGVKAPELTREVKPTYTREAMEGKQQGLVYLEAVVQPEGSVGDLRVLVPLRPELGLSTNAVLALKQWRFTPATLGGRPVPVLVTVEMKFSLR
jgi:TonB family protein